MVLDCCAHVPSIAWGQRGCPTRMTCDLIFIIYGNILEQASDSNDRWLIITIAMLELRLQAPSHLEKKGSEVKQGGLVMRLHGFTSVMNGSRTLVTFCSISQPMSL